MTDQTTEPFDISDARHRYNACPSCGSKTEACIITRRGKIAVQCIACSHRGPEFEIDYSDPTSADRLAFEAWNRVAADIEDSKP